MKRETDGRKTKEPEIATTPKKRKDDDYTLRNVPVDGRKAFINVFIVILGFTFLSTTMAAGAELGVNFRFSTLIAILAIGTLILASYAGCMGWIAAKTGLNSVLLARLALGKAGAKWADILLGGTQIIWYAVQTAYLGLLFTTALGLEDYFIPITIFWGLFTGAFAVVGTRGMEIVAYIALIPFIYLAFKLPQLSVEQAGGFDKLFDILPAESSITFIAAVTIVIGTFISGATNSPNWSRFSKSPLKGFLSGFLAFGIGTLIMVLSGMMGGLAIQNGDMIEVMIGFGIVVMAMVILVFNIWTTNTATAYAIGVAGSEFFNRPNKIPFVVGGVIIGTVVAILGVYEIFLPFLGYLGVFIPPLGGIIIGDHLFNWREKCPLISDIEFRNFHWANWIAYLLATAIAYLSSRMEFGIPTLNGVVSAIVLLFVVNKIFDALNISCSHTTKNGATYVYGGTEDKDVNKECKDPS